MKKEEKKREQVPVCVVVLFLANSPPQICQTANMFSAALPNNVWTVEKKRGEGSGALV